MTVIQPNSISGINSITVQSGEGLSVHKSDGSLIREIVSATGVGTFYALNVGSATSVSNRGDVAISGIVTANGGVKVAAAATISTNGNATFSGVATAKAVDLQTGPFNVGTAATIYANGNITAGIVTFKAGDLQTGPFNVGTAATISANGNATFSGIVTSAGFVGDGSGLTGLSAGTSLSGSTNNTVCTVTGSGAITGEPNIFVNSNRLILGTADSPQTVYAGVDTDVLQINGNTNDYQKASMSMQYYYSNAASPSISIAKSRDTSVGGHTIVQDNDYIGGFRFFGSDGTDFEQGLAIEVQTDGSPAAGKVPMGLRYSTYAEGANADSLTERIRITDKGNVYLHGGTRTGDDRENHPYFGTDACKLTLVYDTDGGNMTDGSSNIVYGLGIYDKGGNSGSYAVSFRNGSATVGSIGMNASATQFNTSSDYRLKENQVAISDGITRLKTLKPYRFNFKTAPSETVDGFFAHEVTAVPEAVTGTKDAMKDGEIDPQSLDQSKLVPLLTAALQEAITKIETLETKVAALESA
tara:strand:- start:57 stop:1640 length:1584 start_codon:yes stop_codon:yes gene_type:complete